MTRHHWDLELPHLAAQHQRAERQAALPSVHQPRPYPKSARAPANAPRAGLIAAGATLLVATALSAGAVVVFDLPARLGFGQSSSAESDARLETEAIALARSTLLNLHAANVTGNYAVVRALAAPGFQQANSEQRLAEIFRYQREQGLDLAVAAGDRPRWLQAPVIGQDQVLRTVGYYPREGSRLEFALAFVPDGGNWRLVEISIADRPMAR